MSDAPVEPDQTTTEPIGTAGEPGSAAPAAAPADASADPNAGADLARRRFFRQFASELFSTAATVVGAAQALQRSSAEAAAAILTADPERLPGTAAPATDATDAPAPAIGFRTPFRWEGDRLILIDQRRLPGRLVETEARTSAEVGAAIRERAIVGAPALGQVAAIGIALSANRMRDAVPFARRATLRGSANALSYASTATRSIVWATGRMLDAVERLPDGDLSGDGNAVADVLWAEAEAIVFQATEDHGRIADVGMAILPPVDDRPIAVLTLGSTGALGSGQYGTALGIVEAAHHAGRPVHVHVLETRPGFAGSRIAAWELEQAGIPCTVLPDAAAATLIASGRIDAVIVGAERIAANGDTVNTLGTYPLAVLAARHDIPFYVCAPLSSVDWALADASAFKIDEQSLEDLTRFEGLEIAPPAATGFIPIADVTPADLVSAIVTEEGVLQAPYDIALEQARDRSVARHGSASQPESGAA